MGTEVQQRLLYQDELRRLREDGARFAARHPRIAPCLGMNAEDMPDPFVERILESVAWVAAGLRAELDARLPLVSQQIMGLLYPNFCAPLPSFGVVSFTPNPEALKAMPRGYFVPRHTRLHGTGRDGKSVVRWRSAWDLLLTSAKVSSVRVEREDSGACRLRLTIQGLAGKDVPGLRIFLAGDRFTSFPLYDWIKGQGHDPRLERRVGEDLEACELGTAALRPAGLDPEDLILPRGQYALPGYQLMQEYFAFPEHFLFWNLEFSEAVRVFCAGAPEDPLDLVLEMRGGAPEHLRPAPSNFDLNAVPVVNLFEHLAEPIRVDPGRARYRLICDQRREDSLEPYSIQEVRALEEEGKSMEISPYFSLNASRRDGGGLYWHQRRVPATHRAGTDLDLYFKDMRGPAYRAKPFTAMVRLLCTSRDKAGESRKGEKLSAEDEIPVLESKLALSPSAPRMPSIFRGELWKLVSQLTLHKVSLEGEQGVRALREILRLYAPPKDAYAQRQIAGVRGIEAGPLLIPLRRQLGGVVRGTRFDVELEESAFQGVSPLLFGAVLDLFLGLYAPLNTASRLRLFSDSRQGVWMTWPARSGERILV